MARDGPGCYGLEMVSSIEFRCCGLENSIASGKSVCLSECALCRAVVDTACCLLTAPCTLSMAAAVNFKGRAISSALQTSIAEATAALAFQGHTRSHSWKSKTRLRQVSFEALPVGCSPEAAGHLLSGGRASLVTWF